jgi:hypothetical protein
MMARGWLAVAVLAGLTACAAPQSSCQQAATAELRALDARIVDAERDLARGFRVIPEQQPETRLRLCAWPKEPKLFCTETVQQARSETRMPLDRVSATRDLNALRAERAELARRAATAQAECR